jgi:transposase
MQLLLGIPHMQVQQVIEDREGSYIVTLASTETGAVCHKCGKRIDRANGYGEEITLRHLPILGKPVFLRFRLPRYQCNDCDGRPTTTQRVTWFNRKSQYTKEFEKHLLLSCVNSTVADVAIREGVGYESVAGVIDRNVASKVDWNAIQRLDVIGVDEVSLKKGHQDFVVIVTGRSSDETHILGVLKDRSKATVKEFFTTIPKRLRRLVQSVCSDMYDGFINAAKEVFGKRVRIVVDRFHVAKLYREGFEDLRKKELRRLKKELSPGAYQKLKGAMWALRKKDADLTDDDRNVITAIFKHSPLLEQAYGFRNQLTDIFDQRITRAQAKRLFNRWIVRVKRGTIHCFDAFIRTLMVRKNEITNYFVDRHNSGFVEGLNNKIKVIKRRCYGILNTEHLFQRISLDLSGYALYARSIKGLQDAEPLR